MYIKKLLRAQPPFAITLDQGGSVMSRSLLASTSLGLVAAAAILSRSSPEPSGELGDASTKSALHAIGSLHPRLAPAGDRVAFSYQGAIWVMPAAGGVMKRLTTGDGLDIEPAWSPDGKRIAYINTRNFASGALRFVDAEDGSPVELPGGVQASGKLAFHPDGRRVLGNFQGP